MVTQDTTHIKEKIISFLREEGPNLPIRISREIGMDSMFASAFLSELLREQKIKISKMRVGTSPIYYVEGTEKQLEKYSEHLNFKEKEACNLLKQNKFLLDEPQHPAIKVALKSIPDFAKNFVINNKLIWRYFTVSQEDYFPKEKISKEIEQKPIQKEKEETTQIPKITVEEKQILTQETIKDPKIGKKIPQHSAINCTPKGEIKKKKKSVQKKSEKFFNIVKEYLTSKQIEILDIEGFSKDDLMLKIKINNEEKILIAYNKKRISEDEIIKAHKKAKETNLKYVILSFGEPLKKTNAFIEAIKQLENISKIE